MTRRILLAIVLVILIATTVFVVPLAVAIAKVYREDEVVGLQRLGAAAAARIPDDRREAGPVVLPDPPADGELGFYDSAGDLVAGTGAPTATGIARDAQQGRPADAQEGDDLVVAVPVSDDLQVIGVVRVSERTSSSRGRTATAWGVLAVLDLIAIGAATAVGVFLARRLSRPVRRLETQAERLGDGDFAVRSDPSGIAEIDRAGAALDNTARRLGTLLDRERAFSADASHQMRTPLTGLRLIVEAELARPRPDPTVALEAALSEIDRLEETIDTLLGAARDDPTARAPLHVETVIDDAVDRWQPAASAQGRTIVIRPGEPDTGAPNEPGGREPFVSLPAIGHVMDIAIENALGHGVGTVRLAGTSLPRGGVRITVSDEGPGIEGDREAVFARRRGSAAGHGIGLALARSLAEAEGGHLRVSETSPTGTTIELVLPGADPMS